MGQQQSASPDQELEDKLQRCHDDHDRTIEAFNKINEQRHRLIEEKGELRRELEQARADLEKRSQSQSVSPDVIKLDQENENLLEKLQQISLENESLLKKLQQTRAELEEVRSQKTDAPTFELPDLDELRDRILASLKLGKQAPGYKSAQKALDKFIEGLGK